MAFSDVTVCEQCEETTDKLVRFRSARVCPHCQEQLESDEMMERRGYRPDTADARIENEYYELMEDSGQ